jgi:hypothetical protein
MAQHPHVNQLGGFAKPEFVLINGYFWDCEKKRRYIQGQVVLVEFTDILRDLFIAKPTGRINLQEKLKGPYEILKFASTNFQIITKNIQSNIYMRNIFELRNKMTHEMENWTNEDLSLTLKELLQEIIKVCG